MNKLPIDVLGFSTEVQFRMDNTGVFCMLVCPFSVDLFSNVDMRQLSLIVRIMDDFFYFVN